MTQGMNGLTIANVIPIPIKHPANVMPINAHLRRDGSGTHTKIATHAAMITMQNA
jgi:hypothetical protein